MARSRTNPDLTYDQRKRIEEMCKANYPVAKMADALGLHRSTIYKEFKLTNIKPERREQYLQLIKKQQKGLSVPESGTKYIYSAGARKRGIL